MRVNLTKKDLINSIYMQIGFSKNISENLLGDIFSLIIENLKSDKKIKISRFGTFTLRQKKSRVGRNPKNMQTYEIKPRKTITFKNSNYFKVKLNKYD